MELKEYIKQSYLRPNKQVLESLGASNELIEYLRTTPWNTNLNVLKTIVNNEDASDDFPGQVLFSENIEFSPKGGYPESLLFATAPYSGDMPHNLSPFLISIDGKDIESIPITFDGENSISYGDWGSYTGPQFKDSSVVFRFDLSETNSVSITFVANASVYETGMHHVIIGEPTS